MEFYQEITLLPGPEIGEAFLLSNVFTQLHLAMASSRKERNEAIYGISFPEYQVGGLGKKIRVFSDTKENLEILNLDGWLERLCDYVHILKARPIPKNRVKGYAVYKRYRQPQSSGLLARRYAKRHGVTLEQAFCKYRDRESRSRDLPYIILRSLSTKQKFSLFIEKVDSEQSIDRDFDSYGLSNSTALPCF